jgi:predicted dehydrogenase
MNELTRRTFLKNSAVAAGAAALSARSWGQVTGANGDIRVAVIGLNGRGRNHLESLANVKGVRVVALCDVDSAVLDKVKNSSARPPRSAKGAAAAPSSDEKPYANARTYGDIRELLAASDIDAVTIATPNHWHSLATIWACQAGKDVYVEKPVSHNIWEGRQLVAAASKYNRVVQAGTQIRSGEGLQEAVAWVRAGNLGKITASRGFCYKRRDSIGKTDGPTPVPASINYDLWSGPAPIVPPHRNSKAKGPVHYDWHWIYLYGNGDVGNQGIHQMDVARWFLGESGLPMRTLSVGGRLGYIDDGETPNTQVVIHDYATAPLIFEVRGLPAKSGAMGAANEGADVAGMGNYMGTGVRVGNVVDCEGGSVIVRSYTSAVAVDRDGKVVKEFNGKDRHMQNFIDVVRSRKKADLYGPIEEGHVSSALCHLGNLSHQIGKTVPVGALRERVRGNSQLAEAYGRMVEHLAVNDVDLDKTPLTLGAPLEVDAKHESFKGEFAAQATPMLTRNYRAPFVVPKLTEAGSSVARVG